MGIKGREFEYKEERDRDLIAAYRKAITDAKEPFSLPDVLAKAVNSPSKRFWVSIERASNVLSEMRTGNCLESMNANKREMFLEIDRRVVELQKLSPYNEYRLSQVVAVVVEQPAPCFYMTPESAKVIIHHIKKRCLKENLKRLRYFH